MRTSVTPSKRKVVPFSPSKTWYAPEAGDQALVLTSGPRSEPRLDRTVVLSRTGVKIVDSRYVLDGSFCGRRTVEFDWLGHETRPRGAHVMTFVWPWMREQALAYLTERGRTAFLKAGR